MFDYKEASFYTDFFKSLPEFSVLEDFKKSNENDEQNLFVGMVEVVGTIHPLVIRVEIPITFPHHHLTFRTKSLYGYPHLIHTGKIQYGSWFCLNTPFAETAEEQLQLEVSRLKEWIRRQMREDLPAIIKDPNVKHALWISNAYEWENPDEVNEFSSQAVLTFVGDFQNSREYFKEDKGHIHCVKSKGNRMFAFKTSWMTNYELPYIIVDEEPASEKVLADFLKLKKQYGWDKEICEHLLPEFSFEQTWSEGGGFLPFDKDRGEEEALSLLEQVEQKLRKDSPYLDSVTESFSSLKGFDFKRTKNRTKMLVQPEQKQVILEKIEKIRKEVKENHKYSAPKPFGEDFVDMGKMTPEELEEYENEQADEEYLTMEAQYIFRHFALGIRKNDTIKWFVSGINQAGGIYKEICFDIKVTEFYMRKLVAHRLQFFPTQKVTEAAYFGRGAFSSKLTEKKIALVGLGAIGSMVAESLARSGGSYIGLWDGDLVEPGNICRSAYSLPDLGESKVWAICERIRKINPYVKNVSYHGGWDISYNRNYPVFERGSFYDNINYKNQEDVVKEIKGYDLVIDCTGNNEMLHFLSYAIPESDVISLCITNHANELVCVSSADGNPFELRKAYLSRVEQDTKNFYVEGTGCYSPTFLACNCDIASLVNLALRDLNYAIGNDKKMHSAIYSHTDRGVLADRIQTYKLEGYDIVLNVPQEVILDAEEMDDVKTGPIGFVLGAYGRDGKQIMVTHVLDAQDAESSLIQIYQHTKGIVDYIGDYDYSGEKSGTFRQKSIDLLRAKAADPEINTRNPLLIVRNTDVSLSFFLFINNGLVPFSCAD